MKSKNIIKIATSFIAIVILCLVSFKGFAHKTQGTQLTKNVVAKNFDADENVIVTIDKKTTSEDFNDIKNMLSENGITATFSAIKRNDLGELTGVRIEMKDNNNSAESQISSSSPIAQITFGRKDGLLFISQSKNEQGALGFFNQPNMMAFSFDNDSIVGQNFNFDNFFNDENNAFFFNGKSMDIDQIREEIKKQMESSGMNFNGFSSFFGPDDNAQDQFNFIDSPELNKLIIIDGKESDFKTLNHLAKEKKLKVVDDLKPETAKSIYGEKAKDGAIIATTK